MVGSVEGDTGLFGVANPLFISNKKICRGGLVAQKKNQWEHKKSSSDLFTGVWIWDRMILDSSVVPNEETLMV